MFFVATVLAAAVAIAVEEKVAAVAVAIAVEEKVAAVAVAVAEPVVFTIIFNATIACMGPVVETTSTTAVYAFYDFNFRAFCIEYLERNETK